MALEDRSKASKLVRFNRARDRFRPLLEDSRQWENECEAVFSEFRVAVVHLRRDSAEMDAVEDKDIVWRFLCKLSRERRPFWGRCEEVLRTLMQSDEWVKAFAENPEANLNDLPTNVVKEFGARVEEVGGAPRVHVRLAIIGCGATAARHCASMARWNERARNDFYQVVALCDPVPARATALRELPQAARLGLQECTEVPTVEALLDRVDFDAAAFCSHHHREGALAELLARGKFVLAEPPLAPTMEAAAKLTRLRGAERLLVAESGEHWPGVFAAEARLAEGSLGEVVALHGRAATAGPEAEEALAEGMGCVRTPGLRWIRALRRLAGPVERVCGLRRELVSTGEPPTPSHLSPRASAASRRSSPSTENVAACLLQHEGGVASTLQLHSCCGPPVAAQPPHILVSGTHGQVLVEDGPGQAAGAPEQEGLEGAGRAAQPREGDEGLWALFSRLVGPHARNAPGPPPGPDELPPEMSKNLEEHLADLAVAQALDRSFQTERFEAVEAPKFEA